MTYGRARLWLGIVGVGSLVSIALIALIWRLPQGLLEQRPGFGWQAVLQLMAVNGLFMLWLTPLDFLGGYWLPKSYKRSNQSVAVWLRSYIPAASWQALLFVLFGSIILWSSQTLEVVGGGLAVALLMVVCFVLRNRWILSREVTSAASAEKIVDVISMIQSWQIFVPHIVVVEHQDRGFTGGLVGLGKHATIVIPQAWLAFSTPQLATAVARRALAVSSGSYHRGLALAFLWNLVGFVLCSFLPHAGLASVAGLATSLCGFTIWSFLGLLVLPTISRNASLKIDQALVKQGMPAPLILFTAATLDQLQDDEPKRSPWIETIFHPVPSVANRNSSKLVPGMAAWNVARTALFFSWACLGILSRSVHCNVGRPELWVMLPTD